MTAELELAGFSDIEEQRIESNLVFNDQEQMLTAFIAGGAVAMAAKRFDQATRKQVESEFLASVDIYRVGDRYEIPSEFVLATASILIWHNPTCTAVLSR